MIVIKNCNIAASETDTMTFYDMKRAVAVEGKRQVDELVFIFSSAENSAVSDANEMYRIMNKLVPVANKVALVITDTSDESAKLLALIMTGYNKYGVFVVDDPLDIEEDYLDEIVQSNPSIEEVKAFVGQDIAAYGKTREVVRELANSSTKSDTTIADTVRNNRADIESLSGILEFLRTNLDKAKENIKSSGTGSGDGNSIEMERTLRQVRQLEGKLEDAVREKDMAEAKAGQLEREIEGLREFKARTQIETAKGLVADRYTPLDMNKFVNAVAMGKKKPLIKDVIYFKEVSPCRYINSFVVQLYKFFNSKQGVSCKLVIYDKKGYSNIRYGKLKVVDAGSYEKEKAAERLGDIFVATEAARNIIEDLITDNQIVIVYDRLGGNDDILYGRNVHHYDVINGAKEYAELCKIRNIERNCVVTNFGTDKRMISIREIYDYKMMSTGGKMSAYVNMPSTIDATKTIFALIIKDCGMAWLDL